MEKTAQKLVKSLIPQQYKLEDYLKLIKDPSKRRLFTKFRISNHKLLIEHGRYQQITREEKKSL